jgi:hypothetical protein
VTVWLVMAARRAGRWIDYLGAGAALGLGWWVYGTSQAVFPVVGLFALYAAATSPRTLRVDGLKIVAAALVLVAVSLPAIRWFVAHGRLVPNYRTGYETVERPSLTDTAAMKKALTYAAQGFFTQAQETQFSRDGGALIFPERGLVAAGLVLAFAWLGRRSRRDAAVFALIALPVTLLPGLLGPDLTFRRYSLTLTILEILAGFAYLAWDDAARGAGWTRRARGAVATVVALVGIPVGTRAYVKETWCDTDESCAAPTVMATTVRRELGRSFVVVAVPDLIDQDLFVRFAGRDRLRRLEAEGKRPEEFFTLVPCLDLPARLEALPKDRPTLVLVEASLPGSLERCETVDPVAAVERLAGPGTGVEIRNARGRHVYTSWTIAPR